MFWAAFTLGLFGSLHCVGMCGPIALSIPHRAETQWSRALLSLQYNAGRTLTYMALGLIFGAFGTGIRLAGFQSWLSIAMGVIILLLAFFALDFEKNLLKINGLRKFYSAVQVRMARYLRSTSPLALGLVNGFLPCGLVYAAIFGAISTGNIFDGALFMALFGAGTTPLMFSTAFAGQWMGVKCRSQLRKILPFFLILMGLMLIGRGLNFDLPYDFRFWQEAADTPMCH